MAALHLELRAEGDLLRALYAASRFLGTIISRSPKIGTLTYYPK